MDQGKRGFVVEAGMMIDAHGALAATGVSDEISREPCK